MRNSKLISLLSTFSPKEVRQFSLFCNSTYFNTNQEASILLDYLAQYHPDFPDQNLKKELIFNTVFPSQVYADKSIRYLMSALLKLAEQFLLVQKIKKGNTSVSLQLLDDFNERNLEKHYNQLRKKIKIDFSKKIKTDINFFLNKIQISDLDQRYSSSQHNRKFDDNIQQGSDYLNQYFTLKKLKYACGMINQQAFLKGSYDLGLPDNWIEWLQSRNFFNQEIIEIYAMAFQALKNEDEPKHFKKLKQHLDFMPISISEFDQKELLLVAINYCAKKIRKGENQYTKEALDLYMKGINNQILFKNGLLSPWTFGNVVKLALRLERYKWTENFIHKNIHLLPRNFQKNALHYNLAELFCYQKEFNQALKLLTRVEFSDMSYHLGSRTMLAKIYYELDEKEALTSMMNSFTMYLKRNKKISDSIRKTFLNFCAILLQITKGKTKNIEKKINQTVLLTDRTWLLEKAKEIE